ncbi:MFS transporter [Aquibacillus saliphilus]|uniref:MFS transporter n=1 Tax=Aquibacillus saliphilus TaxID=1909422 RepID=UPI001CF0ABBB|nr:MFS transporter [Aquibacillus saliphilus]
MTKERRPIWTKSFINVSLTHFMVFVAFYTLLTTLPIYVINHLGGTEAEGGLLVTFMLLAAIIMRPFSGKILEKVGKKKGLIWSIVLFTVTMFFYIWIDDFIPLLILRFFHGLSFGVLTTATGTIAADIVPDERRGEGLGYFAMSMNIAVVIGPFIGLTLLQVVSFQMLFTLLSIIMIGGVICSLLVHVPQSSEKEIAIRGKKFSIHDLFELRAFPIAAISGLVGIAYSSVLSYISVYAGSIGLSAVASYFFVVFAVVMIASRPYLGQLFDLKGAKYVILPCLLIFAIGLVTLSFTDSTWMLLLSAGIIGLGCGSLLPSFQTMAIQSAPRHRSGHATATFFTFYDSGIAIGSYVLGLIIAFYSFQTLYIICATLLLVVFGLFILQQSFVKKTKIAEQTE